MMAADTFICGNCQSIFHDIHIFVQHKSTAACVTETSGVTTEQSHPVTSLLRLTTEDLNCTNPTYYIVQDGSVVDDGAVFSQPQRGRFGSSAIQRAILLNESVEQVTSMHKDVSATSQEEVLEIVPLPISSQDDATGVHGLELQLFVRTAASLSNDGCDGGGNSSEMAQKLVRKRGRPRKGEEKTPKTSVIETVKPDEPELPEKDADGKYRCCRCHKSFMRDRHFRSHRCLAVIGYVDITRKEALDDGDAEPEEQEDDNDHDGSISPILVSRSRTAKAMKQTTELNQRYSCGSNNKSSFDKSIINGTSAGANSSSTPNLELIENQSESAINPLQLLAIQRPHTSLTSKETAKDLDTRGRSVPVFQDENDRLAFDQSLRVDLGSLVDHMFKLHVIDQNVNDRAMPVRGRTQATLNVYSCDTCRKVFMSLSHVRLHCLVHTDLRPFKCFKCKYATNTRGNLYTHMRTHTGMLYRCASCDFTTVNRGHLTEHEQTHSNIRHKCDLCHRDYNTVKSLVNHIRKYHKTNEGDKYLSQFQKKHEKIPTLLHQCQVCNRKFKKRNDLERHLSTHSLAPASNAFTCDVCGHVAGRCAYLEKHLRRHRIVYICCTCDKKFPSSCRLQLHLREQHGNDDGFDAERLFQRSLEVSLFLPEPDGSMDGWLNSDPNLGEEYGEFNSDDYITNTEDGYSKETNELVRVRVDAVALADISETNVAKTSDVDVAAVKFSDCVFAGATLCTEDSVDNGNSGLAPEFVTEGIVLEGNRGDKMNPNGLASSSMENAQNGGTVVAPSVFETGDKGNGHMENIDSAAKNDSFQMETDAVHFSTSDIPDGKRQKRPISDISGRSAATGEESDIFTKLGYLTMNLTIFENIRNAFGREECEFCGRLFVSKSDSRLHQRIHTGEKPFICDQCPYSAATKENLQSHIEKVHDRAVFTCLKCDWRGASRAALWLHNKNKHKLQPEYLCTKCEKVFSNIKRLRIHFQLKHPEITKAQLNGIISSFRRPHGMLGRRLHRCPYCNKAFPSSARSLQKHMWIHEGLKPFKCEVCTYACRSRSNLSAHMLRHSSEKPFLCTKCGKPYKSRTALRWHIRSHKPGHAFACNKCPYTAVQPSHLKRHLESHEVIKRFPCKLCAYSANTETYLKIHCARSHEGQVVPTDEPTMTPEEGTTSGANLQALQCVNCDFRFGNVSDMRKHLRLRHQIELQSTRELEMLVTGVELQGPQQAGMELRFSTPEGVYVAAENVEQVFDTTSAEYFTCSVEPPGGGEEAVTSEGSHLIGQRMTNEVMITEELVDCGKDQVIYMDQNGDHFYVDLQDQLIYISDPNAAPFDSTHLDQAHVVAFEVGTTHVEPTHVEPTNVEPTHVAKFDVGTSQNGVVQVGSPYFVATRLDTLSSKTQ